MKSGIKYGRLLVIMDFTGVYKEASFYRGHEHIWLDLKEIQGANCYCDATAEAHLAARIKEIGARGLHFLDSGNYHYVSKLWLDLVEEDFELLVFDHHTDMQEPAFGGILSCGGWIKAALDGNPRLRRVWLAGPSEEAVKEAKSLGYGERVVYLSERDMEDSKKWRELMGKTELPIYISVDKDVLSEQDARTNWDQGTVRLDTLVGCVREAARHRSVIGMDVCGENPAKFNGAQRETRDLNDRANEALANVFYEECAGDECRLPNVRA